jgi:hypothetical protein
MHQISVGAQYVLCTERPRQEALATHQHCGLMYGADLTYRVLFRWCVGVPGQSSYIDHTLVGRAASRRTYPQQCGATACMSRDLQELAPFHCMPVQTARTQDSYGTKYGLCGSTHSAVSLGCPDIKATILVSLPRRPKSHCAAKQPQLKGRLSLASSRRSFSDTVLQGIDRSETVLY